MVWCHVVQRFVLFERWTVWSCGRDVSIKLGEKNALGPFAGQVEARELNPRRVLHATMCFESAIAGMSWQLSMAPIDEAGCFVCISGSMVVQWAWKLEIFARMSRVAALSCRRRVILKIKKLFSHSFFVIPIPCFCYTVLRFFMDIDDCFQRCVARGLRATKVDICKLTQASKLQLYTQL